MKILFAHSNAYILNQIQQLLLENDVNNVSLMDNGFDSLTHIILNHNKWVIIEDKLPGLNAKDIISALRYKGIRSKFIVIGSGDDQTIKSNLTQTIYYIKFSDYVIENIIKILNKERQSQKAMG